MKNLFFIFPTLAVTSLLWANQHAQHRSASLENNRLNAHLAELAAHIRETASAKQTADRRFAALQSQLDLRNAALAQTAANAHPVDAPLAEPDPTHQGGWPAGVGYCYLPKQCLTNAAYKPINGGRLTDEAAALLGMTPAERSTVDQLLTNMLGQFRQLELKNIQPANPDWTHLAYVGQNPDPSGATFFGSKLDSMVAYKIPDLGADVQAERQSFSDQLQQTLGPSRAQLLDTGADSYLRQNLDDLGTRDRTIGFLTVTEKDGSPAVWYGVSDSLHGDGSFQRVPEDLDPNSQMAYYASLFGVKLPAKK
jgi:hypothetical protein